MAHRTLTTVYIQIATQWDKTHYLSYFHSPGVSVGIIDVSNNESFTLAA